MACHEFQVSATIIILHYIINRRSTVNLCAYLACLSVSVQVTLDWPLDVFFFLNLLLIIPHTHTHTHTHKRNRLTEKISRFLFCFKFAIDKRGRWTHGANIERCIMCISLLIVCQWLQGAVAASNSSKSSSGTGSQGYNSSASLGGSSTSGGANSSPSNSSSANEQLSRTNLYIRGLSPNTTDKDLEELCRK